MTIATYSDIHISGEGSVSLKGWALIGNDRLEIELSSDDPPEDGFMSALQAFQADVIDLLGIKDPEWCAGIEIRGIGVEYKDDRPAIKIKAIRRLALHNSPINLNVPQLVSRVRDGINEPAAWEAHLDTLIDEARAYEAGSRKQRDLFKEAGPKETKREAAAARTDAQLQQAAQGGRAAFQRGEGIDVCPFAEFDAADLHAAWTTAYQNEAAEARLREEGAAAGDAAEKPKRGRARKAA